MTPSLAAELRDIRPPVTLIQDSAWIILGLILLVIFGLAFFLWQRFLVKPVLPLPDDIFKTPAQRAYERLEALEQKHWPQAGRLKEYYTELADIIRRYLEERFCIEAPEMTTQEFLHHVKQSSVLSESQKESLYNFLNSCDLVKFAKYGPSPEEVDQSFDLAQRFVLETREAGD